MTPGIARTLGGPRKANANVHGKETAINARYSSHGAAVAAYPGDVDKPERDLRFDPSGTGSNTVTSGELCGTQTDFGSQRFQLVVPTRRSFFFNGVQYHSFSEK